MRSAAFVVVVAWAMVGCGSSSGGGGDDDEIGGEPGAPGPAAGEIPDGLVGEWYAGRGGTSAPYDPTSGGWGRPNGQGLVYLFEADGTYTKAFQSYASNGGCTNGFTAFERGIVVADQASLTTRPSSGTLRVEDTCAPSLGSEEPLEELADETFEWAITAGEGGDRALWLRRTDGSEATFTEL